MENRGKEEERQGTKEEGKAEKEGAPPWGRRARKMQQRRHDLWYDEGDQTKTSRPKKGRHKILYHNKTLLSQLPCIIPLRQDVHSRVLYHTTRVWNVHNLQIHWEDTLGKWGETLHIRGDTLGAEKGICGLMSQACWWYSSLRRRQKRRDGGKLGAKARHMPRSKLVSGLCQGHSRGKKQSPVIRRGISLRQWHRLLLCIYLFAVPVFSASPMVEHPTSRRSP